MVFVAGAGESARLAVEEGLARLIVEAVRWAVDVVWRLASAEAGQELASVEYQPPSASAVCL